jgi:hypothetical protein
MRKLFFLLCILFLAAGCIRNTRTETSASPVALDEAVKDIAAAFSDMQSDIAQAAGEIAAAHGDKQMIRETLNRLFTEHSYAADVTYIDDRGIL